MRVKLCVASSSAGWYVGRKRVGGRDRQTDRENGKASRGGRTEEEVVGCEAEKNANERKGLGLSYYIRSAQLCQCRPTVTLSS